MEAKQIPIAECGAPLVPIPPTQFHLMTPHHYMSLGAPYGGATPWCLRAPVLAALSRAQERLQQRHPGHRLSLFDAYRPRSVQAFMVLRERGLIAQQMNLDLNNLSAEQERALMQRVYRVFWPPSDDPLAPPPHSTGAVVDVSIVDAADQELEMGSPIDENSDRSNPDHFATDTSPTGQAAHRNRTLLYEVMRAEGFQRMHDEWWHFSLGDQYWAMLERRQNPASGATAIYGRADLL